MTLADDIINLTLQPDFAVYGFTPSDVILYLPGVRLVEDEIIDTGRWFIYHRAVFATRGKTEFAAVEYSEPATEDQDAIDEEWTVHQVTPVTVTTTRYVKV